MDSSGSTKIAFSMAAAISLSLLASATFAQRVPCGTVLREMHRVERRGGLHGGDPGRIAEAIGTSPAWVEKCAAVYGRRLQSDLETRRRAAAQERVWEEFEPEEVGREERETEDDVVQDPQPYRDKSRQRAFSLSDREQFREEWEPYELSPWDPNTGKKWSPYLTDPHRTLPDDVDGLIRD